jgi:2-alkenal reductase
MRRKTFFWILIAFLAALLLACGPLSLATEEPDVEVRLSSEEIAALVESEVEEEVAAQLAAQAERISTAYEQAQPLDTDLEAALVNLYGRTNPAVVYIVVGMGSGSGFLYSEDGYIVTNNHVVENETEYEVVFADGTRSRADLIGADVDSDLAVLQARTVPEGVEPLPLAPAGSLQVGQFVVAIGNPFGEQGSMSLGIVSGLGRSLPSQRGTLGTTYSLPQVVQTDAPINPGNSGGPLLNLDGEVVGVNAAIATLSGSNSGVGFSIPVAAVHRIVPSLIADGDYTYPYMGLAFDGEVSLDDAEIYGLPQTQGAYVVEVVPDGPGDEAGIVAASQQTRRGGDLVVALDGKRVNSFADLNTYLSFHTAVGQTIEVTVLRDGEELTFPLTLGARP